MDKPSVIKYDTNFFSDDRNDNILLDMLLDGELSDINIESDEEESPPAKNDEPKNVPNPVRLGADQVRPNETIFYPPDNNNSAEDNVFSDNELEIIQDIEDSALPENSANVFQAVSLTDKNNITWRKTPLVVNVAEFNMDSMDDNVDDELLAPIDYFKKYLPDEFFENLAEKTNLYATQINKNRFKQTAKDEMQVLFGLHVLAGILKYPRVRLYWDSTLKVNAFVDNMTRDRFFELRTCLHVVNNLERPNDNKDKFYKVRPLYDLIRKRCLELQTEENLCVDEAMVPFTGRFSVKQYIRGKPSPWGIKIFMLCGKSGIVHDFILYQGASTEFDPVLLKKFGLGPTVVLQLCEKIIREEGHKVYFDNFFSSYHLFQALKEKQIQAAGTVRLNRFGKNIPLISDKDIMKKPRGYAEEATSRDDITVVKWLDNRSVTLGSNFVGKGIEDSAERWDKKNNKYIKVNRPEIIKLYNHAMGGVDLFDQLISYYRTDIRSNKWTLKMISFAIDFCIVQSWLEYRKAAENLGVRKNKILDLLNFRLRVADGLLYYKKQTPTRKRGQSTPNTPSGTVVKQRKPGEPRPCSEIQYDGVDHLPDNDEGLPQRCKYPKCTGRSRICCTKCGVHLCLTKTKNCYKNFHTKF